MRQASAAEMEDAGNAGVPTGVDLETLRRVGAASVGVPAGFKVRPPPPPPPGPAGAARRASHRRCPPPPAQVHPRLVRGHVEPRLDVLKRGVDVDWATAEALAFGSLVSSGCARAGAYRAREPAGPPFDNCVCARGAFD